jgi:hypothetical protein
MDFMMRMVSILLVIASLPRSLPLTSLPTVASSIQTHSGDKAQNPPPTGRPPRRRDGGKRGNCTVLETQIHQEFTALVPNDGETRSLTTIPTLWFYVPYAATKPIAVRFSLRDAAGRRALFDGIPFEPVVIPLSGSPGIIGIRLPKALEPETEYHWYLTMICDATEDGPSVDGWVRSVKLSADLLRQFNRSQSFQERLLFYKNANIWSDRLTLLAGERDRTPQASAEWAKALQEIGLEKLTQEAIAPCCVLK